MPQIVITGASGVLGSAVYNAFQSYGKESVIGLAHSRPASHLIQLDLLDGDRVEDLVNRLSIGDGDWIIHCAAERRPDIAEKDTQRCLNLNVSVPANLARLSALRRFTIIHISTDYVFDGTSPPYSPNDETNPLQFYGRTKRDGERAGLRTAGSKFIVIRVPILYGPTPSNADTAVNILLDVVQDQSGKKYTMDHFAIRYPTNVLDIAGFLVRLRDLGRPLPSIIHYSAGEPFTKYEMCLVFARILGFPHEHILPQVKPPQGIAPSFVIQEIAHCLLRMFEDETPRPFNTQLNVVETEQLFDGSGLESLGWNGFEEWWAKHLRAREVL
ncbi:hypothetical protein FRC19_001826 [Serendipita sp. 401]|nr:hypothetical protein FRC19_001826 [Serendipita sp. 401]